MVVVDSIVDRFVNKLSEFTALCGMGLRYGVATAASGKHKGAMLLLGVVISESASAFQWRIVEWLRLCEGGASKRGGSE